MRLLYYRRFIQNSKSEGLFLQNDLQMAKVSAPKSDTEDYSFGKGKGFANLKLGSTPEANQDQGFHLVELTIASRPVYGKLEGKSGSEKEQDTTDLITRSPSGMRVRVRKSDPTPDPIQVISFATDDLEVCRDFWEQQLELKCEGRQFGVSSFDVLPTEGGKSVRFVQSDEGCNTTSEQIGISIPVGDLESTQERVRAGSYASITASLKKIPLDSRRRIEYFACRTTSGLEIGLFGE